MDPLLIEQKDPEFKNPSLGWRINFSALNQLSFLEIPSVFGSLPKSVDDEILEGKIGKDVTLQQWLSKVVPKVNTMRLRDLKFGKGANQSSPISNESPEKRPRGGLRLLYGKCSWDSKLGLALPIERSAFDSIQESLGLPDYFLKVMKGKGQRSLKHTSKSRSGNSRVCFVIKFTLFQPTYYQLALSYCPKTMLTTGLLLAKYSEVKIPELIEQLKISPLVSSQPLYLATLISEVAIDYSHDHIQLFDKSLAKLEEEMGQHEYKNLPLGDPLDSDLMASTRRLHFSVRIISAEAMRLGSMLLTLEELQEYETYIRKNGQLGTGDVEYDRQAEEGREQMDEKIAYLNNACKSTLLRAEFEIKRARSLRQVVSQFMAHKNAISNRAVAIDTSTIAIETKKDSASMKTIALMGMVFLPSVSVAAIFAMPVFDWDVRGTSIIKPGFGYYMAVAVPLTCVVLLIWGLGMRRGQKDRTSSDIELRGAVSPNKGL